MARKPTAPVPVERSPVLSAIEQLGRLIQTGTPAARVTRAARGIACRWRATADANAAREWITTLHADLVSGAVEAEEQVGNVDRSDAGEARQADATLAAIHAARDNTGSRAGAAMRETAMQPLANRLHRLVGRLSQAGGFIVAQADVAEAVARIMQLERALRAVLDHVDYRDGGGCRLGDATPVVSNARIVLGEVLPST